MASLQERQGDHTLQLDKGLGRRRNPRLDHPAADGVRPENPAGGAAEHPDRRGDGGVLRRRRAGAAEDIHREVRSPHTPSLLHPSFSFSLSEGSLLPPGLA